MRISVIVVSYNTKDLLKRCLSTVFASFTSWATDDDRLTVVVVDSASQDGSAQMVAAEFPQVQLLAQSENIGFVAGNNLALQMLGFTTTILERTEPRPTNHELRLPDCVLLLNPDAELVDDALWTMARFLQNHPSAGACGANLCYGDEQFQHGAFRYPSLMQVLIDFFPLTGVPGVQRLHNSSLNGRYSAALWANVEPFPVDFVLGAALMVKGEVIEQIGGLDPAYVMYCEELDWCLRMNQVGRQVYVVPTARVIHHEGQSSKQVRWPSFVRLWRSRFLFVQKHRALYPWGYLFALRMVVRLGLWWRQVQAERRFARGQSTGLETGAEISSYEEVRTF